MSRLLYAFEAEPTALDAFLYPLFNGIAGRSWTLDTLIALALENNLVKAGVIGACFIYAWHQGGADADIAHRRKLLLVTLVASMLTIATTKTLAQSFFLPRPFIQAEQAQYLEGDRLVEARPLPHRPPLDDESRRKGEALKQGELVANDLGSFPSDHAGLFITLAAGIFLASRRAGLIALAWALIVTLGSRIVTGQHSPLDILAGSAIGLAMLALLQIVARRWSGRLTAAARWTLRRPALSSAILFLALFEATNTLQDVRQIAGVGKDIVDGLKA